MCPNPNQLLPPPPWEGLPLPRFLQKPASENTEAPTEISDPGFFPKLVSQTDTIEHQRRELTKCLTLVEAHLRQGCIIAGKPCDCCAKHLLELEALAEETAGLSGEQMFLNIAHWARAEYHKVTPPAVAGGKYKGEYLELAGQVRNFRKLIMQKTPGG